MKTETKRLRELRVGEYLKEVKRAIHDGEWTVALSETEMLRAELEAIIDLDAGTGKYGLTEAPGY